MHDKLKLEDPQGTALAVLCCFHGNLHDPSSPFPFPIVPAAEFPKMAAFSLALRGFSRYNMRKKYHYDENS